MTQRMDEYGSHVPVLASVVTEVPGPVLELGCGGFSTPLLHMLCRERLLLTVETDAEWRRRYEDYRSEFHLWQAIPKWDGWVPEVPVKEWAVVFVDQAPMEARAPTVRRLRALPEFAKAVFVIHDALSRTLRSLTPEFKHRTYWRGFCGAVTAVVSDTRLWTPASGYGHVGPLGYGGPESLPT